VEESSPILQTPRDPARKFVSQELNAILASKKSAAHFLLSRFEVERDKFVFDETCLGEHYADAVGGAGGTVAI
jgi:hypothetical protein